MAQRAGDQINAGVFAHGHFGHDAHAQAQAHVGFDHVGVDRLQHHARMQLAGGKGSVNFVAAGE